MNCKCRITLLTCRWDRTTRKIMSICRQFRILPVISWPCWVYLQSRWDSRLGKKKGSRILFSLCLVNSDERTSRTHLLLIATIDHSSIDMVLSRSRTRSSFRHRHSIGQCKHHPTTNKQSLDAMNTCFLRMVLSISSPFNRNWMPTMQCRLKLSRL